MIRRAWRSIVRFLSSAGFATWLLAIVGAWSALATAIPQGLASKQSVAAWASAHPLIEPVVRAIGLHQAFTSIVFTVCALALGLSTALCAWQRTKVALGKARTLRRAALADEHSLAESHDLEFACDPALSRSDVMSIASQTLERLGIRTKRHDGLLTSASPAWSVWGSPVFHWALLVLIVALLVGNLLRSEGLMDVAVGQTKADTPASYWGASTAGPWHNWGWVHRSIRVDAFEPDFWTGGVDRGPTPTVAVLDRAGKVIKTQRVYPNMTLKTGSLTIYPSDDGLSAGVSLISPSGDVKLRSYALVDFSQDASGGTVPAGSLVVHDQSGKPQFGISITVPLDRVDGQYNQVVPKVPTARVVVTSPDGTRLVDGVVTPGEAVALPIGGTLRVDSIGYYARLQVVDDGSIPLLYVSLVVAMIGLTITVSMRQQIILVTAIDGPEGAKLAATIRLWRNASSSRDEIQNELAQALSRVEEAAPTSGDL